MNIYPPPQECFIAQGETQRVARLLLEPTLANVSGGIRWTNKHIFNVSGPQIPIYKMEIKIYTPFASHLFWL